MQAGLQEPQSEPAQDRHAAQFQHLLEVMPAAAYTTDAEGLITAFNQRAVEVWGRQPKLNAPVDRY